MTAFVIRSLWEVPGTIVIGIFAALAIIGMIVCVIRLVLLFLIVLIGAPFAARRDLAAKRAKRNAGPIHATYNRNGQPSATKELNK